jgi:hypothetical protein
LSSIVPPFDKASALAFMWLAQSCENITLHTVHYISGQLKVWAPLNEDSGDDCYCGSNPYVYFQYFTC